MRLILATHFFPGTNMGGAEYQTLLIAKGLAARGHDVIFLGTCAGRERTTVEDGLAVVEVPGWRITGGARFREQVGAIISNYRPDLCYIRSFMEIADLSTCCRELGIPVVTISCGGKDTSPYLLGHHAREALSYLKTGEMVVHYRSFRAIQFSSVHICNTQEFAEQIRRWYKDKPIRTIYNGSPIPSATQAHSVPGKKIIWVNNIKRVKRPEWYIDLARKLPHYDFVMIGALYSGQYGRRIRKQIEQGPTNLSYLGPLSLSEVNREISDSDLLLYTSIPGREGFGNSFLQAWFRGVPTLSSYPLDGILEREGIGRYAPTLNRLIKAVDEVMSNVDERLAMGKRARSYAVEHHNVDVMVDHYEKLFVEAGDGPVIGLALSSKQQLLFSTGDQCVSS